MFTRPASSTTGKDNWTNAMFKQALNIIKISFSLK